MTMTINNINEFRTADLALTAVICVFGFVIKSIEKINIQRSVFIFENSEELLEVVNKYWRQELRIEPQQYFNQLKILKARIYER